MTSRRKQYTAAFKLQVIKAAEETNNCAAAREFSVSEKLVRDWRKISHKLNNMPNSSVIIRFNYEKIRT